MTTKLKETTKVFTSIFPIWSLSYIGVMLIIYIILNIFSNDSLASFFGVGMTANRTYLLVLAIITMLMFLEWVVSMGVSRRTYFKTMLITGLVTAVFVTAVVGIISFGLSFTPFAGDYLIVEDLRYLTNLDYVIFHFLSGLLFYVTGSLIAASFYRGFWPGMLSISAGIGAVMMLIFNEQLLNYFGAMGGMTVYVGFLLVIILIVIYSWILYAVLKNIPVKIG